MKIHKKILCWSGPDSNPRTSDYVNFELKTKGVLRLDLLTQPRGAWFHLQATGMLIKMLRLYCFLKIES